MITSTCVKIMPISLGYNSAREHKLLVVIDVFGRLYLRVKESKEGLDIKCGLFRDKLPQKLMSFKKVTEANKDSIWNDL